MLRLAAAPGADLGLQVRSGPDGAFDFGAQPVARYVVLATAEGMVPAVHEAAADNPMRDTERLIVHVEACERRTLGVVVDEQGAPVAGARVQSSLGRSIPGGAWDWRPSLTGPDGTFDVCVAKTHARIFVSADGHEPTWVDVLGVSPKRIVLVRGRRVSGRVLDGAGRPVPGAVIRMGEPFEGAAQVTVEDGTFELRNAPRSPFEVQAQSEGRRSSFVVAAGGDQTITLTLFEAGCRRVAGWVRRGDQPLPGAYVGASIAQADGSFVWTCAPTHAFEVRAEGHRVDPPVVLPDGTESVEDIVLHVASRGGLSGIVVADNVPVEGVRVSLDRLTGDFSAVTDASGRFSMPMVTPGDHSLRAWHAPTRRRGYVASVVVPESGTTVRVELLPSGRIEGRVVDPAGQPIAEREVRSTWLWTSTGRDGSFSFEDLSPGSYLVSVPGCEPVEEARKHPNVEVRAGETTAVEVRVNCAAESRPTIRGRVLDTSGAPVANASIRSGWTTVVSDDEGRFELEADSNGANPIVAYGPEGHGAYAEARPGEFIEVRLAAPGTVRVSAGGCGSGVTRFRISQHARPAWVHHTTSGGGEIVLQLVAGRYDIQADCPGHSGTASVDVAAGRETVVHVPLVGVGAIAGAVTGVPVELRRGIRCVVEDTVWNADPVSSQGIFSIPHVPAGDAIVRCSTFTADWVGEVSVEVVEGKSVWIEVPMQAQPD
jgi:protocatechuate 3,4-dioxygenase beta subunit